MTTHYIYLIPGFFGFSDLGGLTYFHHVSGLLTEALAAKGVECVIHGVKTRPTGSIPNRAQRLLETIHGTTPYDDCPIHLIGHSTGGLDARLLASKSSAFVLDGVEPSKLEHLRGRIKTVVTVATPHRGTPMASFFTGIMGQKLLLVLTLLTIYSLRFGKAPLSVITMLGGMLTKADDLIGLDNTVLDQLYDTLLGDFTLDRRKAVDDFLDEVRKDQSLTTQLTPAGIELFNATTADNPDVRYGSVMTQAQKPGLRSTLDIGLDPYAQLTHAIYRGLYTLTSGLKVPGPDVLNLERSHELVAAYDKVPDGTCSDGVVPTLSQLWGEVIHATWADHLDVVGHFDDGKHDPPHVDWIATGSDFSRKEFEVLWRKVAAFL